MNINLETANKKAIKWTLKIILVTLYVILIYSLFEFCIILVTSIINHPVSFAFTPIDKTTTFLQIVFPLLSGILVLVIIVEMIESIIDYIKLDRSSYIYIITEIALIALIRHLITLDLHHIEASEVMGIGVLTLVITAFYIGLKVIKNKGIE